MDQQEHHFRLQTIIDTAPFPIGIYTGDKLNIELANAKMIEVYGKGSDVLGKSCIDILPNLRSPGIFEQIKGVLNMGIPLNAKNHQIDLLKNGILTKQYFDYNFTPLFDSCGKIFGLMHSNGCDRACCSPSAGFRI